MRFWLEWRRSLKEEDILKKNRLWMGTSNVDKYMEAKKILEKFCIKLTRLDIERVEIQADDPKVIAEYSLKELDIDVPIIVEDSGLYIDKYFGFPGPYSSYVLRTIDNEGILKLMENEKCRSARYLSAVAYKDENNFKTFIGEVRGSIALEIRGTYGFGYDPIFIPKESSGLTFGEISVKEKNKISHRARAFRALGIWIHERAQI
jgi:XTP/dITP diphosphohydrolase